MNALVAWTVTSVEPGTRRAAMELPLAKVLAGSGPIPGPRAFTGAESGGYRFVAVFGSHGTAQAICSRATRLFGPARYQDPDVALFAVTIADDPR